MKLKDYSNEDIMGRALTESLDDHVKTRVILPGIYAGWDPAEINDRSALTILAKDISFFGEKESQIRCRLLKDLSLDRTGHKTVKILDQARRLIEIDKVYKFTKLLVDCTNERTAVNLLQEHFKERVLGISFSKPLKREMIRTVRILFQEKEIQFNPLHRNFTVLRKELYELDPVSLKHPNKGTDDFVWSLALAVKSTEYGEYVPIFESGESNDVELIF